MCIRDSYAPAARLKRFSSCFTCTSPKSVVLAALDYAPGFAPCEGKGFRRLFLFGKHDFQPHGVAINTALVNGREIAGWIVTADGPTALRSVSPARREFSFCMALIGSSMFPCAQSNSK